MTDDEFERKAMEWERDIEDIIISMDAVTTTAGILCASPFSDRLSSNQPGGDFIAGFRKSVQSVRNSRDSGIVMMIPGSRE